MFRVLIPFNTTWFGFFVALLILTITATVYLHTHRLIGSSQALVAVINILGGSAIAYLAIYGMGFEQLDTGVLFYVKRGANADWFSLATVLANCLVASWVIYIWSEQRINGKRAAMYFGFPIIISGYLVFLWYQLGWPLAIALPTWIRFPVRPDWFNFLVELLGGLALFKAIVDRLKSRTSNKHLLFRFIVALSTIVLLVVGWYSLARVLPMPTVPDWLVILVSASTTPVVLAEMFSHLKRRRFRISTFSLLNSAFLILIATLLIVWNLPRVLAWAFAEYDQGHRHCNITDPFYKLAIHWFPLWSEPQQRLVDCTAGVSSIPNAKQHKIAFLSNRDGHSRVYVMNADGSDQRALTGDAIGEAVGPATWSSDGRKLAFTTQHNGSWEIYTMNADGSNLQLLHSSNVVAGKPLWMPDGRHIAFTSFRTGHYQTYLMDRSGTNTHRLLPTDADQDVIWSPNGIYEAVTVSDGSPENRLQLYITNSEGSINYLLLDGGFTYYQPTWSPDGQQIAFTQLNNGYNIMLIRADGSGLQPVTYGSTISGAASWSPDGKQITFESNRAGRWAIYVVNKDSKQLRCLTRTIFDSGSPTWQP